jgi:hypothetical protein
VFLGGKGVFSGGKGVGTRQLLFLLISDKDNGRAQAETSGHGQKTTSLQGDGEGYRGRTDVKLVGGGRG